MFSPLAINSKHLLNFLLSICGKFVPCQIVQFIVIICRLESWGFLHFAISLVFANVCRIDIGWSLVSSIPNIFFSATSFLGGHQHWSGLEHLKLLSEIPRRKFWVIRFMKNYSHNSKKSNLYYLFGLKLLWNVVKKIIMTYRLLNSHRILGLHCTQEGHHHFSHPIQSQNFHPLSWFCSAIVGILPSLLALKNFITRVTILATQIETRSLRISHVAWRTAGREVRKCALRCRSLHQRKWIFSHRDLLWCIVNSLT